MKSNNPFLSIVIPVYNGANTVKRCLDSIWNQDIDEELFEVICVNDCSKDNTLEVLEEIQKEHLNLRVLSNAENLRAGGGRNYGVREAKGEYILFIDADDYFHPGSLKRVVEYQQEKHWDILVCDFARHTLDRPNDILVHNFKSQEVMTGRQFLVTNSLPYAPWKYVFKRSLMMDNSVFFAEKVSCEDVDWTHKLAFFANTMQYQPILLTHYILMDTSQTSVEYKNANTVFHRLECGRRITALVSYCRTEEEKSAILGVAAGTLKNGIIFLNGLTIAPSKKVRIIEKCVSNDFVWGGLVGVASKHKWCYSCFSTFISPFFRLAIIVKRKYLGR